MTNPTLDTTAPYDGMTVNEMMEEILRRRGLTLDSDSTGRTPATSAEQADVLRYLKRAHTMFNAIYPGAFAIERVSGTWTSGDTAILLPDASQAVVSVYIDGRWVAPLSMEDRRRAAYKDTDATNNLGFTPESSTRLYWYLSGYADADAVANGGAGAGPKDWRAVLQIAGQNDTGILAVPYVIDYVRSGDVFAASATEIPRIPQIVMEWLILRAAEMWASAENDEVTKTLAMTERADMMDSLWAVFDEMTDTAERARWTYPTLPENRRRSD